MKGYELFEATKVGSISLLNHIVMAPLTRGRAIGNIPNDLMGKYYQQRSNAGLIITEGTSPSINGLGYARIPGIFSEEQTNAWKHVTFLAHTKGAKIFVQLMHTGRIGNPLNLPKGAEILAPSPIKAAGQIYTDAKQMQDYIIPKEMSLDDISIARAEYVEAAKNAMTARFNGVELHSANGYLLEQFISPHSNIRTDNYGGSIENRCRFVIEVVTSVAAAIGKDKTGIRFSPYGVANDMQYYPEVNATYEYLSKQLNSLGIAYIHIADHSSMGAPAVPIEIKKLIRKNFTNAIILCGGYDKIKAEADLISGLGNLIAFGRPFINNPDLVERLANNWALSDDLAVDLFYSADAEGYIDYPFYHEKVMAL